jgi:hypothetical protein
VVDFTALTRADGPVGPMVRRYISVPKTSPWVGRLIAALPGMFAAAIVAFALQSVLRPNQTPSSPTIALFLLAFVAISVAIPLIGVLAIIWKLKNTESVPSLVPRLPRFAADNGWHFSASDPEPTYPGSLFAYGSRRTAVDHIRSTTGRYFDFGEFRYVISGGESDLIKSWGFVAIHLGRPLPHIVVEATLPGFPGWKLPFPFNRSQVLSLEGDFDQHFTLFCPAGYERDALYIFAPDLMSLLVDSTGGSHVEIIDGWFFVYVPKSFVGYSAEDYQRLLSIIELVGAKALRQTGNYVDHRTIVAGGGLAVSAPGLRLRPGSRRRGLAVLIATVLGIILGIIVATLPV